MNLKEAIQQPHTTIVDVREPSEFHSGHIEGALNIPLGSIPARLAEFEEMGKPILLYCYSGGRSRQATLFLQANGIPEAYNAGSLNEMYFLTLQTQG